MVGSTPVTTVAGGGLEDSSGPSEVAMVCCLGSRRRARLMPKEDWRNQGMEILRLVLLAFLWAVPGETEAEEVEDGPPPPPPAAPAPLLGLALEEAVPGEAEGGRSDEEDMAYYYTHQEALKFLQDEREVSSLFLLHTIINQKYLNSQ